MKKISFKIEKKIYKEKIIKLAIKDFKGFTIKYNKSILEVFGDSTYEIEEIFNEFMNYVIGIQNETI